MLILGIESSADESSIALVKDGKEIIKNITISQINKHKDFNGIVPELAAREHLTNLPFILENNFTKDELLNVDYIALTTAPGLAPALQVGKSFTNGLSYALNKPIIKINHVHAHGYAVFLERDYQNNLPQFPMLMLVASGGHTQLMLFKENITQFEILGSTIDDAAGEAFDKIACMLDLGYPGGPIIESLALKGDNKAFKFPRPLLDKNNLDFSFSGLKTAVRYHIEDYEKLVKKSTYNYYLNQSTNNKLLDNEYFTDSINEKNDSKSKKNPSKNLELNEKTKQLLKNYWIQDTCASFQQAVVDVLINKTAKATTDYKVKSVVIGGGVSANSFLINSLANKITNELKTPFYYPSIQFSGDNAAMIAGLAFHLI